MGFILTLRIFRPALMACLFAGYACCASAENKKLLVLNPESLSHWEEKEFSGHTIYEQVKELGRTVIKAHSQDSASGLFREIRIDLNKTPYINWRWKVQNTLSGPDESTKAGDDYPARVYVVVSGGVWFWKTKALNYVWSSQKPVDTTWPNAFTANAVMLAVESGNTKLNTWSKVRRNVLQDLKTYLKLVDADHIDAVAIMTDTDNTGSKATAYYGEIYFSD